MPILVLPSGTRVAFDPNQLRKSLEQRGLTSEVLEKVASTVESALPVGDADVPIAKVHELVGDALLTTPFETSAFPDEVTDVGDECLINLVDAAFGYGITAVEQAYVAGVMAGESPVVREVMASRPFAVLGLAETTISSGYAMPVFSLGSLLKEFIKWIGKRFGREAAKKAAKEVAKKVAKEIPEEAGKSGWRGVFRRLGILGAEFLTFYILKELIIKLLEDPGTEEAKKKRLRKLLEQVEQGVIDPDLAAEQIERIMAE